MESRVRVLFINGSARLTYRRMDALTEDQPTVVEETPAEPRGSLRERWVPLGLVLGGGVWNFLVGLLLGDGVELEDLWNFPFLVAIGTLLVQPMLCAVWAAYSSQRWFWRLPVGLAATVYLALSSVTGGSMAETLLGYAGIYVLFLLVLPLIPWRFHLALPPQVPLEHLSLPGISFGTRYLFYWMSAVAVLGGLVRMLLGGALQDASGTEQVVISILAFSMLLAPPAWLLVYLLRSTRVRMVGVVLICLSVPPSAVLSSMIIVHMSPDMEWDIEVSLVSLPVGFICLGAMFTVALVAIALRWAGYRLSTPLQSPVPSL